MRAALHELVGEHEWNHVIEPDLALTNHHVVDGPAPEAGQGTAGGILHGPT